MKKYVVFLVVVFTTFALFAQGEKSSSYEAYWDIAMSANIWIGAEKTVGIQTSGGIIFNRQISIGAGIGIGSRNYEYLHIPIEAGAVIWKGNGAVRIYGGPTFSTFGGSSGYLAGTEVVLRPRFDMRNLKLFVAFGIAFDKSDPYPNFFDPFGSTGFDFESNVLASPRFRIGLVL